MEYLYEGIDNKGKEISGSIIAESKVSAINKIREMGYFPTSVTEKKEQDKSSSQKGIKSFSLKDFLTKKSVKEKELVTFMRQFATLVDAGLPILRGIRVLEKQNQGKGLQSVLKDVGDSVESGNSLSASLMTFQNIFSPLFVNMVHAGEVGGVLDKVLLQMADYFEKTAKLKKKIKAAMVYPVTVLVIAMTVVYGLVSFIIPKFAKMFQEMELQLPAMTKMLIETSRICKEQWYIPIILLIFIVIGFRIILSNRKGRHVIHQILFRMPLLGVLIQKVAIARYARTFGTLINSGVQILESLMITKNTIGNSVVESAIDLVHDNLKEGESMVQPLVQAGIFPPMVVSMVSVGEETGRMSEMLLKIAESYEDDVDAAVAGLTSLIEPLLIIGLAMIVAFIVIAMFLPLISLISSMTQ
ncbi:MAG: type II secretion system F family protein [Candidatus Aureabacteria bacterium]|nr:type II secretion system F family protein [Candidatus Auribacterota bacterium]